ncbi:AAA ATPase [Coemansia sp. RSA 552]|nr:AAA ATPase [Coemansia sp. RSA 552]
MPAARTARASIRRKALAEAPITKQQQQQQQQPCTLKSAFPVTKHYGASKQCKTDFVATKTVLHRSTAAPQIIGRETEQAAIRAFLRNSIEAGRGGSMYISGNPGTGKTACLQALVGQTPSALINCVPLSAKPTQVYSAILGTLGKSAATAAAGNALPDLEARALRGSPFLIILDEVDALLASSRQQEVLYRLFELAARPNSRLALVGIANALDLTDRFLPRLQARNCEPLLLNFNPYKVPDIVAILQSRLDSVVASATAPIIQKAALELCARKVAATSGDLRKALDVCRQAMDLAEGEARKKAKGPASENSAPAADKENAAASAPPSPKVTIMHVVKVLATLNGSPTAQKLAALNFQQKLVLCAHVSLASADAPATPKRTAPAMPKKAATAAGIAVSALYAEYAAACTRLRMPAPVTRSEFLDLISMMEIQGVVTVTKTRSGRRIAATSGAADDRTVRLAVDASDVRRALASTAALAPLL